MANIGHKSQGNASSNYTTVEPSDEAGKYVKIYVNSDEVQQKTIVYFLCQLAEKKKGKKSRKKKEREKEKKKKREEKVQKFQR